MRVGILAGSDWTLAHGEARDALAVGAVEHAARAVDEACRVNGFEVARIAADADPRRTLARVDEARVDVVFQLAETIGGEARLEAALAWLLEWARIPYTGSGPEALTLALNKPIARAVLQGRRVGVPKGFVLEAADALLPFALGGGEQRWIVKPAREDASHGIAFESVVSDEEALRARARHVIETYAQPALIEEFVDGREFNVSILGAGADTTVLPLSEVDFRRFPSGRPQLVTFAAKWNQNSPEYQGTSVGGASASDAGVLDPTLERELRSAAVRAYRALGLAGYGRVDLRLHPTRGPLVLDVNPNPDIAPDAGFARAAALGGINHAQLIARIIEDALARAGAAAGALAH